MRLNTPRTFLVSLCLAAGLFSCGPDLPEGVAEAYDRLPESVDYNFHVKPILSDRCFACHGPDAENQQAGLRLDTPEGAYAALESGHGVAVRPGSLGGSEMFARITSDDPELVMPTPESNLTLDDREIAILTKWIEQGAEYKTHWAFQKPERPEVPAAGEDWAENEIDRFVAEKLEREEVAPNPEAEREYLIRRVYFDLNGLPPTLEEIDRWLADDSGNWYENLVDELIARPAYGERMAMYWMDVARFADSEGYLDDFHHEFWPYRDWVINSYNENMPHDRFIEWQLGGDLIENAGQEQVLATAFNRLHKQNSEGGVIPEEFRVDYVADRANTVGTAFLGLTVACARCHDHKYDPISQQDYFELFSFFNNTVERGDGIFGANGPANDYSVPNRLKMNAGPTLLLADSVTQQTYDYLHHLIAEKEEEIATQTRRSLSPAPAAPAPTAAAVASTVKAATVTHLPLDGNTMKDLASGQTMDYFGHQPVDGKIGGGLRIGDGQLYGSAASSFEHSEPYTISFWIRSPKLYPEAHFLYNGSWRTQGYRGWDIVLDSSRVHFRLNHAHPYQSLDVMDEQALTDGEWTHYVWSYDGSGSAENMRVYRNGEAIQPRIVRNHLVRSTMPYRGEDKEGNVYAFTGGLVIGSLHYDQNFVGGALDEVRVLDREAGDLVARYLYEQPTGTFTVGNNDEATAEYFALHQRRDLDPLREELTALRNRAIQTVDTLQEIMVMGDNENETRQAYILDRGVYDAHGKPVENDIPEALMDWPENLERNRLGLGKWITHPDNPLTARVAVNQLWYVIFGRGLVESVEDFGNQGSLPSHPELLDWLAVDYRESGWDTKRMIRKFVTSATYKQSSKVREELRDRDPDNYWLARSHRYRRDAEMVRDNMMAVAGMLDEDRVGGPSTFPYQPGNLWLEISNHPFNKAYQMQEKDNYRRSMYTFWKRNAPNPMLLTFDASLRTECVTRRQRSNTPLQALVLLNDPITIEACRVIAANALDVAGTEVKAAERIFRQLTGRRPTANEREIMLQYYEQELTYFHNNPIATNDYLDTGWHETDLSAGPARVAALARVTGAVMNTTEGYYKN